MAQSFFKEQNAIIIQGPEAIYYAENERTRKWLLLPVLAYKTLVRVKSSERELNLFQNTAMRLLYSGHKSTEELAEMLELTTSHMGLIERGERGATALTLAKISRAFDTPIDSFFENPKKGGLTIREHDMDSTLQNRKKIHSLIMGMDEVPLQFMIDIIKGTISLCNRLTKNDMQNDIH